MVVNLTNSRPVVGQLVTSTTSGQTATVLIQPGQQNSPTTVAAGGVAFDPLDAGETVVSSTIDGLIALSNASRTVTVTDG
jgi:hypothetical protein